MRSFVKTIALTYLLQFATTAVHALEPEQMYDGGFKKNGTIALRIGNGGAGQSGLIRGKYMVIIIIVNCPRHGINLVKSYVTRFKQSANRTSN